MDYKVQMQSLLEMDNLEGMLLRDGMEFLAKWATKVHRDSLEVQEFQGKKEPMEKVLKDFKDRKAMLELQASLEMKEDLGWLEIMEILDYQD